jgi:hypothetical protein
VGNDPTDSARTVDYKTLFLGACVLVSLLGGSIWGLWNSNHHGELEESRKSDDLQWIQLRTLSDKIIENTGTIRYLQERSIDQEKRLRDIESEHKKQH